MFPAYAGHGDPHDPVVLGALGEHAMIRHRADALTATTSAELRRLRQLGAELAAHVRLEEREVFPSSSGSCAESELNALAQALEAALAVR